MKKKTLKIRNGILSLLLCAGMVLPLLSVPVKAEAAEADKSLYSSGYVKITGGGAWTFNEKLPDDYVAAINVYDAKRDGFRTNDSEDGPGEAGAKAYKVHYEEGTTVNTGVESQVPEAGVGQHTYDYKRTGDVPVGKWVVQHQYGACTHVLSSYDPVWHGLVRGVDFKTAYDADLTTRRPCGRPYYSGWVAYCADCGRPISKDESLMYASQRAVSSVNVIDTDLAYYYICPYDDVDAGNGSVYSCRHLEQAVTIEHTCSDVSYNRYCVKYDPNCSDYAGKMGDSFHMYNNADQYEGEPVTAYRHLSRNRYTREGYTFVGWTTMPDGSGQFYSDCQEILNLTDENYDKEAGTGIVTLYAKWAEIKSTLVIDANGGTYEGQSVYTLTKGYGASYVLDTNKLTPPEPCIVSFELNGGTAEGGASTIPEEKVDREFAEWRTDSSPFYGAFIKSKSLYKYLGKNDGEEEIKDVIKALYKSKTMTLPSVTKTEDGVAKVFAGWYLSSDLSGVPVGMAGGHYTPPVGVDSLKLYAKWSGLNLEARNDYTSNDGKGAVDLNWEQKDQFGKFYEVYQSTDGENYTKLTTTDQEVENDVIDEPVNYSYAMDNHSTHIYTVPADGLYRIYGQGQAGGDYGEHKGGKGAQVAGIFKLSKGDQIRFWTPAGIGTGASGGEEGAGGGSYMAVRNATTGNLLLVAGGGGGANLYKDGEDGSCTVTALEDGINGEAGVGGGGGGANPGAGGNYTQHIHSVEAGCYHVPSDSCYQWTTHQHNDGCYKTERSNTLFYHCVKYHPSHRDFGPHYPGDHCDICNGTVEGYYPEIKVLNCTIPENVPIRGDLDCGYQDCDHTKGNILTCGKFEGVSNIAAAQGGTCYLNSVECTAQYNVGTTAGGTVARATIRPLVLGYTDEMKLDDVAAPDLAAPDQIADTYTVSDIDSESRVIVTWERPEDNGTDYYHRVKSFTTSGAYMTESNVTLNTLTVGVAKYYYVKDQKATTLVNATNKTKEILAEGPHSSLSVAVNNTLSYLHLVAVDKNGNYDTNLTIHIPLTPNVTDAKVETEQIGIGTGENIYKKPDASKTYYVRADGRTRFDLNYTSKMVEGQPRPDCFVDIHEYLVYPTTGGSQFFIRRVPYSGTSIGGGVVSVPGSSIEGWIDGDGTYFGSAQRLSATRTNGMKNCYFTEGFTVSKSMNGTKIMVVPHAGITLNDSDEDNIRYSDIEQDKSHEIYIIPDGDPPVVTGTESWDGFESFGVDVGFTNIDIGATDALSGLKSLKITVKSVNNLGSETFTADESGEIHIDCAASGAAVFAGEFTITVVAIDNVGNQYEREYKNNSLGLEAGLRGGNSYARGDSTFIDARTFGYAEKLVFKLPEELVPDVDSREVTFTYSSPRYEQPETVYLEIPRDAPTGTYPILVTASKASVPSITKTLYLTVTDGEPRSSRVRVRIR